MRPGQVRAGAHLGSEFTRDNDMPSEHANEVNDAVSTMQAEFLKPLIDAARAQCAAQLKKIEFDGLATRNTHMFVMSKRDYAGPEPR